MGLSIWQILIIVAVVLLLFGANRIPRMMRDVGSGITQFKKGLKDSDGDGEGDGSPAAIEAKSSKEAAPERKGETIERT